MGHDAIAIVGSGLESTPDTLIWHMAFEQDRILITQDLDFPLNIRPTPPGLVLIRYPDTFDFDVQMELTKAFFAEQTEETLVGKITVHAPGHTRNRDI